MSVKTKTEKIVKKTLIVNQEFVMLYNNAEKKSSAQTAQLTATI